MEIRVLRYFLTVVREESISRAAEVLHITQPTLSRQLAQLEEETGVKLFQRGPRGISLTNEGMLLRRRAEEIVELVERTAAELPMQQKEIEGTVSIGGGEVAAMGTFLRMCGDFRREHPKVVFDVYTAAADVVKERLERGLIDIGLLLEPIDMERFDYIRLAAKERYALLMRAEAPLAKREFVTREDLMGLPLIVPRRLNVQSELANWFGEDLNALDIAFTGNLFANSALAVRQGCGYAIAVENDELLDPKQLVSRPLKPELSSRIVLAWKRGQPFGAATQRFLEYVKCLLSMDDA